MTWDSRLEHAKEHCYRECDQKVYEDLEGFTEHMKDFHSTKVDPHQKGFGNLPDGCQQLLKASCQVAESAAKKYMKTLRDLQSI